MTRLRDLSDFDALWERRTVFTDDLGMQYHFLSIPNLVQAKKTQRQKDWPVIELLGANHYRENGVPPMPERITFWLKEIRTPELLQELTQRFPAEVQAILSAVRCWFTPFAASLTRCEPHWTRKRGRSRRRIAFTGCHSNKKWRSFTDRNTKIPNAARIFHNGLERLVS